LPDIAGRRSPAQSTITIDAVSDCAQACAADADVDMSEQNLTKMIKYIRRCLHSADSCTATAGP
jgi:hypothetical protein